MSNQRLTKSNFKYRVISQPNSNYPSKLNSRNNSYDGIDSQLPKNSLSLFQSQLNQYLFKQKNMRLRQLKKKQTELSKKKELENQQQFYDIKSSLDLLKNKIEVYKKKLQINNTIGLLIQKSANVAKKNSLPTVIQSTYLPPPSLKPYNFHTLQPPLINFQPPPPHMLKPIFRGTEQRDSYYEEQSRRKNRKRKQRNNKPQSQQQQEQQDEQQQKRPQISKLKKRDLKMKMKLKKLDREKNRVKLRKYFKSVLLAVAYIFFLKSLTKKIMAKRRSIFNKFWPDNLFKATNAMRKWFSNGCKPFFDQMIKKSQAQLQIDGDQSQPVLTQKKKTIKILIGILIKCIQDLVQNKSFDQITQILHIFCKHGAFIQNGVLTPDELQTVCISQTHGYLRMDKYLQKSQILNFLFLKLIIFNMILQPWKYNQKLFNIEQNKQSFQNFYYISSVLYQIILFLQDKYLDCCKDDQLNTQIGNWRKMKSKYKIKCSPSLCYLEHNYQTGQIISGLVNQNIIKQYLPIDYWNNQIQKLEDIVQKIYMKLRKIHAKLINQIFQYKDMNKFQVNSK